MVIQNIVATPIEKPSQAIRSERVFVDSLGAI